MRKNILFKAKWRVVIRSYKNCLSLMRPVKYFVIKWPKEILEKVRCKMLG